MSTTLAFLSGKGGSGKTTLALSMSHLLHKCNVHVLLVDCDMSTNGATYFYESQLFKKDEKEQRKITSFNDLIKSNNNINEFNPLKIDNYLDFIPSVLKYQLEETLTDFDNIEKQLIKLFNWAQSKYDVVLFDCQAGYTSFLQILLPLIDIDLFVLETDSISGSSMRSLHLKVGQFLGQARLYQVFNKATEEEFKIYSKIVGTFFTNIGTLLFDWRIRQAFSRSQIPDIDNTSAEYGLDLCNICKIIFNDEKIQKNLQLFCNTLSVKKVEEEYEQTEKKLYNINENIRIYNRNQIIRLVPLLTLIIYTMSIFLFDLSGKSLNNFYLVSLLLMFNSLTIFIEDINYKNNNVTKSKLRKDQWENENKLKLLNKKIKNLNNLEETKIIK